MPAELQIPLALISTTTIVGGFIFAAYQFVTVVPQRRQETALTSRLMEGLEALAGGPSTAALGRGFANAACRRPSDD
jgi:hypothetical protein